MAWAAPRSGRTGPGERYGPAHRAKRAAAARHHRPDHPCARCGHPLGPLPGLHYDHNETGGYLGFSHGRNPCPICHRRCNLTAASHKANAAQRAHRTQRRQSRDWL